MQASGFRTQVALAVSLVTASVSLAAGSLTPAHAAVLEGRVRGAAAPLAGALITVTSSDGLYAETV